MGTNFYFKHINDEEIEEDIISLKCKYPFLRITIQSDIHIAKTSAGWKPLFHSNEYFESIEDIKNFYFNNFNTLIIEDSHGKSYTWEEFEERVIRFNPNGLSRVKYKMGIKCLSEDYSVDKEGYEFYKGEWS